MKKFLLIFLFLSGISFAGSLVQINGRGIILLKRDSTAIVTTKEKATITLAPSFIDGERIKGKAATVCTQATTCSVSNPGIYVLTISPSTTTYSEREEYNGHKK